MAFLCDFLSLLQKGELALLKNLVFFIKFCKKCDYIFVTIGDNNFVRGEQMEILDLLYFVVAFAAAGFSFIYVKEKRKAG